jgi:hypothetical protein
MGCGKESRPGNCNTPGWALRNSDTIDYDTSLKEKSYKTVTNIS